MSTFKDMTQPMHKQEIQLHRNIQKMKMYLKFKTIILKFRTIFLFHIEVFRLNADLPSNKPNASHESQEKEIVAMIMQEPLPGANKADHDKDKWKKKGKEKWL